MPKDKNGVKSNNKNDKIDKRTIAATTSPVVTAKRKGNLKANMTVPAEEDVKKFNASINKRKDWLPNNEVSNVRTVSNSPKNNPFSNFLEGAGNVFGPGVGRAGRIVGDVAGMMPDIVKGSFNKIKDFSRDPASYFKDPLKILLPHRSSPFHPDNPNGIWKNQNLNTPSNPALNIPSKPAKLGKMPK